MPGVAAQEDWRRFKTALTAHAWVVYAIQPLGGPEQVLEYLGCYTHRVAISNERIVAVDGAGVAFRVRAGSTTGKKRTLHVAGETFIERFLLHVLPRGFKRIRHYGLLAPAHKAVKLAKARAALANFTARSGGDRVGGELYAARGTAGLPSYFALPKTFVITLAITDFPRRNVTLLKSKRISTL